jgi:putative glutamine amidotransferase
LYQAVQEVDGKKDHRESKELSLDEQYSASHLVKLNPDGKLADILGVNELMVNSLHGQGIDRLATGLEAEAYAEDGLVEAVSVKDAKTFALGVQWHPEWKVMENPHYLAIFKAFGEACKDINKK